MDQTPRSETGMMLQIPLDLELPSQTRPFLDQLNLALDDDDAMYAGNDRHYLSCGASALAVILSSLQLCGVAAPASMLDFGAGAGRVTRWLRAAFPDAAIDVCDLRISGINFCARSFRASSWVSGTDIASLRAPHQYDLIWLGSVVTHLSADDTRHLIDKVASWCRRGGLVVLSFHGRHALARQDSGTSPYIDNERWMVIQRDYLQHGFGYSDYPGYNGYGISVTKPSWMAAVVEQRQDLRIVSLSERAWDGHHDIVAIQVL